MKLRFFLAVLIFTAFVACEHQKTRREPSLRMEYKNRHKSVLIQDVGPPDTVSSDGLDGEILTYTARWKGRGRYTSYDDTTFYRPPQEHECKRMFFCNKNGVIYKILEKGC